jgi:transposase
VIARSAAPLAPVGTLVPVSDPAPDSKQCDLSTTCLVCGALMREEHAHYRCPECGWRDSCCDGPY